MSSLRGVNAGILTRRITVQSASELQDAAGQPIKTWSDVVTDLPARVEGTGGGERWRGMQIDASTQYVVEIRYRSDVVEEMRINWQGLTLDIVNVVDPEGTRQRLLLMCVHDH